MSQRKEMQSDSMLPQTNLYSLLERQCVDGDGNRRESMQLDFEVADSIFVVTRV